MEQFLKNAPENVATAIAPSWNGQQRGIPKVRRHAISPAFAVTYNKVQGQTLSRVVLLLATPKGARLGNLTIEMFFVGISRVRDGNHLRIMPCARADLDYLENHTWCVLISLYVQARIEVRSKHSNTELPT